MDSAWSSGDLVGSRRASTRARKFSIAGIIFGSIVAGVVAVLVMIDVIATIVWAATVGSDDDD